MHRPVKATITALFAVAALAVAIAATASGRPAGSGVPAAVTPTATPAAVPVSRLAADVLEARLATAKYANNLNAAKADGYSILTRMIPSMGYPLHQPEGHGL